MQTIEKPFFALTAEDLMSRPVEVLPQKMPLREAAHFMSQSQISGAPVVDEVGRCVGVLSATDFLHLAEKGGKPQAIHCMAPPCVCSEWQLVDLEFLPNDEVQWYMTADPVTALDRKSTRLNSSHIQKSRMPSSA